MKKSQFEAGSDDKTKCDIKKRSGEFFEKCKHVTDQMNLKLKKGKKRVVNLILQAMSIKICW